MSNKTLIFLIAIAIVLMMVLIIFNYVHVIETESTEEHIGLNDIRGMEVYHKGTPYTLNLKQQVGVATYLNEAVQFQPAQPLEKSTTSTSIAKILIFRFDGLPPIDIIPVYYEQDNLVFSAQQWSEHGLFMEDSKGKLKNLLAQTFDH